MSVGEARPVVAIEGVGVVGGRMARELVSAEPRRRVELHVRSEQRRQALSRAFGGDVELRVPPAPVADSVRVVVLCGPQDSQPHDTAVHLEAGRHVVAVADRPDVIRSLLGLDSIASAAGVSLVVGAAFSPGLSGLMAARLAMDLDVVHEVHYARHGAAGRLCATERLASLRSEVPVWHDRAWITESPGTGRELCWFPDPIGGADAYRAATGEPLLAVQAFATLERSSARLVMSRWDRIAQHLPVLFPPPVEGGVGALRVEVRGMRGSERTTRVLGTLDRPGVASAALGAEVVNALLAGSVTVGAAGLESWSNPGELLVALHRRGIRMAELD